MRNRPGKGRASLLSAVLAAALAALAVAGAEGSERHIRPVKKPAQDAAPPAAAAGEAGEAPDATPPAYPLGGSEGQARSDSGRPAIPPVEEFLLPLQGARFLRLLPWAVGVAPVREDLPPGAGTGADARKGARRNRPAGSEAVDRLRLRILEEKERVLADYAALADRVAVLGEALAEAGEWSVTDAERARIEVRRIEAYRGELRQAAGRLRDTLPPGEETGGIPAPGAGGDPGERLRSYDEDILPALEAIARDAEAAHRRGEIGFLLVVRREAALLDVRGERWDLAWTAWGAEAPGPGARPGEAGR